MMVEVVVEDDRLVRWVVLHFNSVVGTEVLDKQEVCVDLLDLGLGMAGRCLLLGGGRLWLDLQTHVIVDVKQGVVNMH